MGFINGEPAQLLIQRFFVNTGAYMPGPVHTIPGPPCSVACVIFITQSLCHDLQKLLRILLLPADPLSKCILQGTYKTNSRNCFSVQWPFIQRVQHIF